MAPYLVLLGASALVRAVLMVVPVDYVNRGQHVLWSWPVFGVVVLGTLVGAWCARRAGLPLREGLPLTMETGRHVVSYGANVAELMFIRSSGLFAGLSQRCATYAWWHVAWGGWGST